LAKRSASSSDAARARALQRDHWTVEAKQAVLSPPATPRTPRTPSTRHRLLSPMTLTPPLPSTPTLPEALPLPASRSLLSTPSDGGRSAVTSAPSSQSLRAAPRARARSKNLTPLKVGSSRSASTASPAPKSSGRSPTKLAAPTLPAPSLAERGGLKAAAQPRSTRRAAKASSTGSAWRREQAAVACALPESPALPAPPAVSTRLVAAAVPATPAIPSLPPAKVPQLPAPSENVPTAELATLFFNSISTALTPAVVNEQWMAVRSLIVAAC